MDRDVHTRRRGFLKGNTSVTLSLAVPGVASAGVVKAKGALKKKAPQKACILWVK